MAEEEATAKTEKSVFQVGKIDENKELSEVYKPIVSADHVTVAERMVEGTDGSKVQYQTTLNQVLDVVKEYVKQGFFCDKEDNPEDWINDHFSS